MERDEFGVSDVILESLDYDAGGNPAGPASRRGSSRLGGLVPTTRWRPQRDGVATD
jgi:hypothetical protein